MSGSRCEVENGGAVQFVDTVQLGVDVVGLAEEADGAGVAFAGGVGEGGVAFAVAS